MADYTGRQAVVARHPQARQSLAAKEPNQWVLGRLCRLVALSNRLARIAWTLLAKGYNYDPGFEAAAIAV